MKKIIISFSAYCLLLAANCIAQGTWTQKADFGGFNRINAVGFSIGTKGYIGTGNDSTYSDRNDFWEYDPAADVWTQKADFIGQSRSKAIGFSIGTKGYIGIGYSISASFLNDFYEWDQTGNVWTQKNNFPGNGRMHAIGFSIGVKGYIGTGLQSTGPPPPIYFNDFWEWDQGTDTWTQKANFGLPKRAGSVGFSIGNKGYIETGWDGSYYNDLWEWNQGTNSWTQKASFGGSQRYLAVGFSIGAKGYIGTGSGLTGYLNDFLEWDQTSNTWTQKANFDGAARDGAIGFSIGNKGYIGTGASSSTVYFKDFWEWDPNGIGIDETELNASVIVFPNPSGGRFTIQSIKLKYTAIEIYNINGEKIFESNEKNTRLEIDLSSQPAGVYFVQVRTSEGVIRKKLILK